MPPSDIGRLCLHVTLLAGYCVFSVWLRYYYLSKQEFFIQARGPRLLVMYGISNTVLMTLLIIDLQWNCLPCILIHILGFLFPSLLITPMILRAVKIIAVFEDRSRIFPFLRFRVILPGVLTLNTIFAVVGYITSGGINGHVDDVGYCIVFHHWIYFLLMMGAFVILLIAIVMKLRQAEDRFYVSRELIGHMVVFVVFFISYFVVVLLVFFDVVDVEAITSDVRPQYYIIVIGVVGIFLSFCVPIMNNYYRDDSDWSKQSDLTADDVDKSQSQSRSPTGSPLQEPILVQISSPVSVGADVNAYMNLSIGEMMMEGVTREALYQVSKKALCPELVHFLSRVQEYVDLCESEQEQEESVESRFVEAVASAVADAATPVVEGALSSGRRSSIFEVDRSPGSSAAVTPDGPTRMHGQSLRSTSIFSKLLSPVFYTSSSSFDLADHQDISGSALDASGINQILASQYAQYLQIVDTYLLEYSSEQINISGTMAETCCALVPQAVFMAAPAEVRKNIFSGAVTEVHSLVRINLFMDIKKYLRAQLKQNATGSSEI
jgi:hypothetical protein